MGQIIPLAGRYPSRYGVPVIGRIDTDIFSLRYFTHCMACGFCHDQCCDHGVDIDFVHVRALERHADALERFTGVPRGEWFTDEVEIDPDVPGGGARRTRVRSDGCVFLNRRAGRGCSIHAFCADRGIDYHELKSLTDCLFPLTYYDDVLCPAAEVADGELVCVDQGPTLYQGIREEVRYYFGDACVRAIDRVERRVGVEASVAGGRR